MGKYANNQYPLPPAHEPWRYEGNLFQLSRPDRPIADFPAFPLCIPVASERGMSHLNGLSGLDRNVAIKVDGDTFFAIQPKMLKFNSINEAESSFISCPSSDPLFSDLPLIFKFRQFNEIEIDVDIFWLECLEPYSDVYVTGKFMERVKDAGLTGLEFVELVFDNGRPCMPQYPITQERDTQKLRSYPRYNLEMDLLANRGSALLCPSLGIQKIVMEQFNGGVLSHVDRVPDIVFR